MQSSQRTILSLIFGMSCLFLWDAWQKHTGQPSLFGAPVASAPGTATATPGTPSAANGSSTPAAVPSSVPVVAGAATPNASVPNAAGVEAAAAIGGQLITLKTDTLAVDIDTKGGVIRRTELLKHKATEDKTKDIQLLESRAGAVFIAESGFVSASKQAFPDQTTVFTATEGPRELGAADSVSVDLTAESGGLKVVKRISLKKGSYEVVVNHDLTNTSAETLNPQLYLQLTRDGRRLEASQFYSTYTGPVVYTDKDRFKKIDFADIDKKNFKYENQSTDGWMGVIQQYFVTAWIPTDKAIRDYSVRSLGPNLYALTANQTLGALAAGASTKVESRLFVGPQDTQLLEKTAPGLDLSVDYGLFTVISKPLKWLLDWCYSLVKNWGWAIIMLTAIVKLAFFPLQNMAYKSMARMKVVGPKMKALQERYGNDKVKLQTAMMEMYKTEKINPMGSCLPILLQIPVFFALYSVLIASVEVRGAPWMLWIKDLAAPDPWYILPLVLAATSFVQMKMSPPPPDPVQAKIMLFMPLMFSVMFFFFPAGLVVYWLANNIFSIIQQWYINKTINAATPGKA
jgi:YidC/Oxa1 family membrane protein insertase